MKIKLINLLILMVLLMGTSCNNKQQTVGIDFENLDTLVRPQDDFYQFACGGWKKNNPLTAEYARYGTFDKLRNENQEKLKTLIETIASEEHKEGSVGQKIGDLFTLAMDSNRLNKEGFAPIKKDLEKVSKATSVEELKTMLPELQSKGYNLLFTFYVGADAKNSNKNLVQSYQTGIGMGQRDYYLAKDKNTRTIRKKYVQHIAKMFSLVGADKTKAKKCADAVMKLETRLAKSQFSNVELRNPYTNYNKMSFAQLQKDYSAMDWKKYFGYFTEQSIDSVSIGQIRNFAEVNKVLKTESLKTLKAYFKWHIIDAAAPYLSDDFNKANFDFYSTAMSGVEQQKPRWKRAVSTVNGSLGEAVGELYVKEYFPPAAKKRMINLVANLQETLKDRIEALEWMGDTTKLKAIEKLNNFHVKIGYPDKWKDYTSLKINKENSFWTNMTLISQFSVQEMIDKIGKPVDKDEWLMSPQTVNAYYQPTTNEICFPAAILQPPFFDMEADNAMNYGAIGVVIGHEMTHGFDDQGSQFDKDGNLNQWWTAQDRNKFEKRADVLVKHFDNIEVAPNVYANGKFTLGENIADFGGLQISYQAFQNTLAENPLKTVGGFTPEQRFFIAYASVWAGNIRPKEILNLTKTDPHSLGEWRVNGTLPEIDAWYEAFDVKKEDKLYIPKDKRAVIW